MKRPFQGTIGPGLLTAVAIAACGSAARSPAYTGVEPHTGNQAALTPAALARADSGRPPYTAADAHFLSGMIGHHAQAVLMAGWAPSHGASQSIRALCERIVVGQRDEIAFMQRWLRERHETVPDADASLRQFHVLDLDGNQITFGQTFE